MENRDRRPVTLDATREVVREIATYIIEDVFDALAKMPDEARAILKQLKQGELH